ncbi:hypothetical protein LOAG_14729, partial [Loa loa]|uniref:Uncharacterized protein n=1 Tax=Loa loa TaxID=7209 RepID=A0A1I7VJF8_LOALO
MSSGSGGTLNRFRISSVTQSTNNNQKQEEQEPSQHPFQLIAQPQPNVPIIST